MLRPPSDLSLLLLTVGLCLLFSTPARSQARADHSPHTSAFVTANGVRLNYLDWGGKGDVILMLAGLGSDAHVFDEFAPQLNDKFHVIALTRRGSGSSDKPASGYDLGTRVEDIRQFLGALGIAKVNLVGHSAAGDEMTLFASLYPRRVNKLVYLEAAYTRTKLADLILADPGAKDLERRLVLEAIGSPDAVEYPLKEPQPAADWDIYKAMYRSLIDFRPDYTKVGSPILAFFATPDSDPNMPKDADEATGLKWRRWWHETSQPFDRASREQLRREAPAAQIIEIKNASHMIFQQPSQAEVVRRTREFLLR